MIIKTNRIAFTKVMKAVSLAIGGRTDENLKYMKMVANDDAITFVATNGANTIKTTMPADEYDLGGDGAVLVDPRIAIAALGKSTADNVVIAAEDNLIRFKLGNAMYNLPTAPVKNFPDINMDPEGSSMTHFVLKGSDIATIERTVGYAVSTKETRPVLCGVNLMSDGGKVVATATDSYRLAKRSFDIMAPEFSVTIPGKMLDIATSLFVADDDIDVYVSDKAVVFADKTTVLKTTLFGDAFPDTSRLIPVNFSKKLTINRVDLISALERAMLLKEEGMTVVKLNMAIDDVELISKTQGAGNFEEALGFDSYEGENLDIAMNAAYLRDALRAQSGNTVSIRFNGPVNPFVVEGEDEGQLSLLLPVRQNG